LILAKIVVKVGSLAVVVGFSILIEVYMIPTVPIKTCCYLPPII